MDKVLIVLGCVSAVCAAYYIYGVLKGNQICNQLANMLVAGRYEDFGKLAGSEQAKRYAKPFTLSFLKLNSAIAQKDDKQVNKILECFEKEKLNQMQESAVYSRVFYYYVANGNYDEARSVYSKMLNHNVVADNRIRYVFNTYCEGGFEYIEELEKLLSTLKEEEKTEYYALLADMYKNKKDMDKSEEYRNLVLAKMKQVPNQK